MSAVQTTPELASLIDAYAEARRAAAEATERSDALKDQLKVALIETAQVANASDPLTDIVAQHGQLRARLHYVESWRIDSARIKREAPEIYAAYARKSTSLTLNLDVN